MRTWIVGLGVVSPLAANARGTMRALLEGKRAQSKVTLFDVSDLRAQLACEVSDFRMEDVAPRADIKKWSRSDGLALIASREALAEGRVSAALPVDLIVGGTTGGLFMTEARIAALHKPLLEGGEVAKAALAAAAADETLRCHPVSATADRLFETAHRFGRTRTLCSACSSSANAIALADMWIQSGKSQRVLAGGTDALCKLTYFGFNLLQAMDPAACRPFDAKRMGMNIGEGAAFVLLESDESARARGVSPIAELTGFAIGSEAHHITNPESTGKTAERLMRAAVSSFGLSLADVGYVNAHGTATPHNDRMESAALSEVFGARLSEVMVSSSKGQIGHTLGAAGAIEAVITALAIHDQKVPPTMGLETPDPTMAVMNHVRTVGVSARPKLALSSSFGFGGSNTVLAIAEPLLFAERPAKNGTSSRKIAIVAASVLGPEGLDDAGGATRYLTPGAGENVGATSAETLAKSLDPERGRRLDRGAALATAISGHVLRAANIPHEMGASARTALVCGVAFRREEDFAAFLSPILERGFRAGKPAVFPNLLLSSPAGHASIYLGVRGPVFTTSDLSLSVGTALASSADLLEQGVADMAVAATVAERDAIVERAVGPRTYGRTFAAAPMSPSASAFVLRFEDDLPATNASALAILEDWQDGTDLKTWAPKPPPSDAAWVLLPRPSEALGAALDLSPWAHARRIVISERAGSNEATAGIALGAAVGAIARGEVSAVLVLDHWAEPFFAEADGAEPQADGAAEKPRPGRFAAFTLVAP